MSRQSFRNGVVGSLAVAGTAAVILFGSELLDPSTSIRTATLTKTVDVAEPNDVLVRSFAPPPGSFKSGPVSAPRPAPAAAVADTKNETPRLAVAEARASHSWKPVVNRADAGPEFRDRLTSTAPGDDSARAELVRALQHELLRGRCYTGPVNGAWSAETRRALDRLLTASNAQLPTAEPDYVHLSLARGLGDGACETAVIAAEPASTNPLDNPATTVSQPGRMAVGAVDPDNQDPPQIAADAPVQKPTPPRPRRSTAEDLFLHPLGTH